MRRSEREIKERAEIDPILHQAQVCRLGLCRGDQPYVVPVSFGYDGTALYFHSAGEGMKIDYLIANPRVCFEVDTNVAVVPHAELACSWSANYASVIGFGRAEEITDLVEKQAALDQIMRHYAALSHQPDQIWEYNQTALVKTHVWRITIEALTGKQNL